MPQRFQILPDLNLYFFEYSGHVSRDDHRQLAAATASHPDYHPGLKRLGDNSRMTSTDLDFTALIARRDVLAEQVAGLTGPLLWAFHAPTELGYGMARMSQFLIEEVPAFRLQIFEHLPAALDYLGLPLNAAHQLGLSDRLLRA